MAKAAQVGIARQKERADWQILTEKRTAELLQNAKNNITGGQPDTMASGLAPYIDLPLVPLPPHRRAAFLAHLCDVIAQSFYDRDQAKTARSPDGDPDFGKRVAKEAPEPLYLNATCIACQGRCCLRGGGTHAYIEKETIDYLRWKNPELQPDDIIQLYLARLPEKSVADSCVFHGEQGCTQTRDTRAHICNSYQCDDRIALEENYSKRPGHGAVVAGIARDHVDHPEAGAPFVRVVSVTEDGEVTIHSDLTLPALEDDGQA